MTNQTSAKVEIAKSEMPLRDPADPMQHLPEDNTAIATRRAIRVRAVRQGVNLSVGVAGILGGAFLLTTNLLATGAVSAGAIPWVSLSANAALILGGMMFLREYRRGRARGQSV